EPAAHGVLQRLRLLINLLQHEVRKRPLVGVTGVPVDLVDAGVYRQAVLVEHLPLLGRQHAQLVVIEVDDLFGLADQGAGVAGQVVLAVADPDYQRAAETGTDDEAGEPRADDRQAVGSLEQYDRVAHRLHQVAIKAARDQVGDDLRVGLAAKDDAV